MVTTQSSTQCGGLKGGNTAAIAGQNTGQVTNLDHLPNDYAMIVSGDSLEPHYREGEKLVFSRTERPEQGDTVIVWVRPEYVAQGSPQSFIMRMVLPPHPDAQYGVKPHPDSNGAFAVVFDLFKPNSDRACSLTKLLGIHKCIGRLPETVTGNA